MKIVKMLFLLMLQINAYSAPGDKDDLLEAWEKMQQNSPELEVFEKIEPQKYKIEFKSMPYKGTLTVLAYDVEEMPYTNDNKINKNGYIEIELPDAPEDLLNKHFRTYEKWNKNNNFFFNSDTNSWITPQEYFKTFKKDKEYENIFLESLMNYWGLFIVFIIFNLIISQISNNKKAKKSLALQEETNELLKKILHEVSG